MAKVEQERDSFLLTVNKNLEGVLERLNRYQLFALEAVGQNLEQVFLEYSKEEGKEDV